MEILTRVLEFLRAHHAEAYLVGGMVRDQLLHRASARDIDLALRGDAVALARAFANQNNAAFYLMDAEHGVARVLFRDAYVDFAQLRGELLDDLATRDFTINAMARRADQPFADPRNLIDPWRGVDDLRARQIRAVSDRVFKNDPVRLLRAIRQAGELEFTIDAETQTLMRRDAALLRDAAMERARDEWMKILALSHCVAWIEQMDRMELLAALVPEVTALKRLTQPPPHELDAFEHTLRVVAQVENIQADGYAAVAAGEFADQLRAHFAQTVSADHARGTLLRLAALLHDVGKVDTRSEDDDGKIRFLNHEARGAAIAASVLRRLRFSNEEIAIVVGAVRHHLRPLLLSDEPHVTNRAVYRFFRDTEGAGVDVCVLSLADQRGKRAATVADEETRIQATLHRLLDRYYRAPSVVVAPPRWVDGRTLMRELNLPPGPRVGELLEAIREAQAEGEVKTREDALALARKITAESAENAEKNLKSEI